MFFVAYVQYLPARLTRAHYALYGLFAAIVLFIALSLAIIALVRNTNRFQSRLRKYMTLGSGPVPEPVPTKETPTEQEGRQERNGIINTAFKEQNEVEQSVAELHKRKTPIHDSL